MYLWQSSLPACIVRCFITSTLSFIDIVHDSFSWPYGHKTCKYDLYTLTWNSQLEHYPMYKMIWLDDFVVQYKTYTRNCQSEICILCISGNVQGIVKSDYWRKKKMIGLDDFVVQIWNSYSKMLIVQHGLLCLVEA